MSSTSAWILSGVRTPFAKAGGPFRDTPVYELGRVAVAELLARQDLDPARLDHVVLGNCAQPAEAANAARVTALRAGVPERIPGVTVHRNCASGMEAVSDAAYRIAAGESRVVLAGGMESMSQIPLFYTQEYGIWLEGLMRAKTPLQKLGSFARFRPRYLQPRIARPSPPRQSRHKGEVDGDAVTRRNCHRQSEAVCRSKIMPVAARYRNVRDNERRSP